MISVVIPTYKEPHYLSMCLHSLFTGRSGVCRSEVIVVVDGFYEENKNVLSNYKSFIEVIDLKENRGMISAMNIGTYNTSHDLVFHVQDDNVFPMNWDLTLTSLYKPNTVITPNQIEPRPSIFKQFEIKNFGETVDTFDYFDFVKYEKELCIKNANRGLEKSGSTFPFLISKKDYLRVGGFDETYPGPWVVDWEFFRKCEMSGMEMLRSYAAHFYHFSSISTSSPEKQRIEQECHEYYWYKWGEVAYSHPETNSKIKI